MIGIVIPSYNEKDGVVSLVKAIHQNLDEVHHIFVVDDSSDSITVDSLKSLNDDQITVQHRKEKGGRGSAVIKGIELALEKKCEYIIEMDADFSHPPSELPQILNQARENKLDLLIGSRYLEQSAIHNWPLTRRIFSRCANWLAKRVLNIPIKDYTNGYRCYSAQGSQKIVESCGKMGKGFIALSEILVQLYYSGFKVSERPTIFKNRVRGESSVNFQEIYGAITGLMRIYRLKQRLKK